MLSVSMTDEGELSLGREGVIAGSEMGGSVFIDGLGRLRDAFFKSALSPSSDILVCSTGKLIRVIRSSKR